MIWLMIDDHFIIIFILSSFSLLKEEEEEEDQLSSQSQSITFHLCDLAGKIKNIDDQY